jgi:hypothetical protein
VESCPSLTTYRATTINTVSSELRDFFDVGGEGCHKPGFAASLYPAMRPRHHGEVPMRAQLRRTPLARSSVSRHERLSARPAPTPSRTLLRSAGRGKRFHVFLQFRMDASRSTYRKLEGHFYACTCTRPTAICSASRRPEAGTNSATTVLCRRCSQGRDGRAPLPVCD